ncbi:DUF1476 domain-containing protein [Terasakiella sp. A23]|uniref:DUF1476 domain-containing protein n=1 Tax=Terasakiella sp. FCG-A23 TaxID=3080561 RepID=UPI0029553F04|nr:DUF1476 domain-containing protein [Terasakiella sp. A23]MDV7338316.1 DUF1476 domain-containing protein [Terasakiella sp. A23]
MSDIASTIRDREIAFEAQYKLNEEQNFKIRARRDRLFGAWIAEKIGLSGEEAEAYALNAARIDLEAAGDGNLLKKVIDDLDDVGKVITNDELHSALSEAFAQAQRSMLLEYPEALDRDHYV